MSKAVGFAPAALLCAPVAAAAEEDHSALPPPPRRSFPAAGSGRVTIEDYDPKLEGDRCVVAFSAAFPNGRVFWNVAEFRAVPVPGGTLCTDGEWRAADGGGAFGATPFRVFFGRDGVRRGSPWHGFSSAAGARFRACARPAPGCLRS